MQDAPTEGVIARGAEDGSVLAAREWSGTRSARVQICEGGGKIGTPNGARIRVSEHVWLWGKIVDNRDLSPIHATVNNKRMALIVETSTEEEGQFHMIIVYQEGTQNYKEHVPVKHWHPPGATI